MHRFTDQVSLSIYFTTGVRKMSDTGTGTTIAFGTSSFSAEITSISSGGISRESYDTSHMGTTGSMTKAPKKLVDQGTVDLEFKFDPDAQPPISGPTETVTITFPIPSGDSAGATLIGSGFITNFEWGAELEEEMTASATLTWAAAPAWTAAS
jgi:hypothetical protein